MFGLKTCVRNAVSLVVAFVVMACVVAGLGSSAQAGDGYDGRPADHTRFVWRSWTGSGFTGPGACRLNKCVLYQQTQALWLLQGVPPRWVKSAEYTAIPGIISSPACPSLVNGMSWQQ